MSVMTGQAGIGAPIVYYLYYGGRLEGQISVDDAGMYAVGPAFAGLPSITSLQGSTLDHGAAGGSGSDDGIPSSTGASPTQGIAPTPAPGAGDPTASIPSRQVGPPPGSDFQPGSNSGAASAAPSSGAGQSAAATPHGGRVDTNL